jgi:hypothetical protein
MDLRRWPDTYQRQWRPFGLFLLLGELKRVMASKICKNKKICFAVLKPNKRGSFRKFLESMETHV